MKIHNHHLVPLFVSLILLCVFGLASGKKNLLSQIGDMIMKTGNKNANQEGNPKENRRRRLLEEKGSSEKYNVDIDAATGTVQDTAAKKEATCDGQLASALVQANDEVTVMKKERDETLADHKLALEKIGHLEKVLTQSESNLIEERDARGAIEIEITRALKVEKDRSIKELTLLKDEKDGIISSLKEESVQVLEQVKEKSQNELYTLKKGKDEIIEELESTLSSELEKAKKEKDTMIASLEADRDATVTKVITEMKDEIEHLKQDRDTKVTELTAAMKVAVENVEQDRDTKVTELTQTIQQAAEVAAEVLRTTKDEAKTYLLKQVTTIKDDLAQAKVEYDELLTEKNKKIKNLQEYTEKMLGKKSSAEQALYDTKSELEHWRSLHSNRSYCNMTHFTSDVYDASANAYSQTLETAKETATTVYTESRKYAGLAIEIAIGHVSDGLEVASGHVSVGLEYSKRFVNDQMDELWPKIQPYYKEHITDNYETLIEPHLKEHVFPMLHRSSVWFHEAAMPMIVQTIEDGRKFYDAQVSPLVQKLVQVGKEIHQTMIGLYGEYCQSSLEEFRKASKEVDFLKNNPPPIYFMESWKKSCTHPQESLSALMQGTLLLFTIIFHRRILGLIWWITTSLVSIVIRFTPLRFVFSRRSGDKSSAKPKGSSSPTKNDAKKISIVKSEK